MMLCAYDIHNTTASFILKVMLVKSLYHSGSGFFFIYFQFHDIYIKDSSGRGYSCPFEYLVSYCNLNP